MPSLLDRLLPPAGDAASKKASAATAQTPPDKQDSSSGAPADSGHQKPVSASDLASLDSFLDVVQQSQPSGSSSSADEAAFDIGKLAKNDKAIAAITDKLQFLQTLPPEVATKLKEGDANAFIQAIEHVGRQSYALALRHGALLVAESLKGQDTAIPKAVQVAIQQALADRDLSAAVPSNTHATTQLVLKGTADAIRSKYPHLTPAEAMNAAQNMLTSVTDNLRGETDKAGNPVPKQGKINWDTWAKS